MEYKELKNKGLKELHELLSEKRNELRELRFKASENQLKDVANIDELKKDIARILTAINAKKLTNTGEHDTTLAQNKTENVTV